MIEVLRYTILAIVQFINGIYNIKIEFFAGTQTRIGDLTLAACIFVLIIALVLNIFLGNKGDDW